MMSKRVHISCDHWVVTWGVLGYLLDCKRCMWAGIWLHLLHLMKVFVVVIDSRFDMWLVEYRASALEFHRTLRLLVAGSRQTAFFLLARFDSGLFLFGRFTRWFLRHLSSWRADTNTLVPPDRNYAAYIAKIIQYHYWSWLLPEGALFPRYI